MGQWYGVAAGGRRRKQIALSISGSFWPGKATQDQRVCVLLKRLLKRVLHGGTQQQYNEQQQQKKAINCGLRYDIYQN